MAAQPADPLLVPGGGGLRVLAGGHDVGEEAVVVQVAVDPGQSTCAQRLRVGAERRLAQAEDAGGGDHHPVRHRGDHLVVDDRLHGGEDPLGGGVRGPGALTQRGTGHDVAPAVGGDTVEEGEARAQRAEQGDGALRVLGVRHQMELALLAVPEVGLGEHRAGGGEGLAERPGHQPLRVAQQRPHLHLERPALGQLAVEAVGARRGVGVADEPGDHLAYGAGEGQRMGAGVHGGGAHRHAAAPGEGPAHRVQQGVGP